LEVCFPRAGDSAYTAKLQRLRERLAEAPGRPLVLLLGSSRTLVGIRAERFGTTPDGRPAIGFNFGLQGGGPLLQLVCLRRLLADGIRPDLLFVEVLPLLFNQPHEHPIEEEWLRAERLTLAELLALRPYHTEPARLYQRWLKSQGVSRTLRRTPLWRELAGNGAVRPAVEDWLNSMDGHGWNHHFLAPLTPEYRRQATEETLKQYTAACGEFRLAGGAAGALAELLRRCRHESIPVVLYHMPEGAAFRSLYAPGVRKGLDDFIAGVCRHWNLSLIDARDWVNDDGCWDSHHLLPDAAVAFTERLRNASGDVAPRHPRDASAVACPLPAGGVK
jgi:hypothetical protein